jgi:hypothetical protein
VTVAITDAYAAPTILQDANTYASSHGQAPFRRNQFQQILPRKPFRYGFDDQVNGDLCGEQGWYGEETLDSRPCMPWRRAPTCSTSRAARATTRTCSRR